MSATVTASGRSGGNTGGGAGTGSGNGSGSGAGTGTGGGGAGTGPKGRNVAIASQALGLIAAGLVLIVAAPAYEPLRIEMRPATEQEQRDYDRHRLIDALDELRQQEGATALHKP